MNRKKFQWLVGTKWCLLGTTEPSNVILDGTDLEREREKGRESEGVTGERRF